MTTTKTSKNKLLLTLLLLLNTSLRYYNNYYNDNNCYNYYNYYNYNYHYYCYHYYHYYFHRSHYTNIPGAEWYIPGHDHTDVPCAVCRVPHPTTVMVPGTKACPQGWTAQYSGHIMAADVNDTSSSEFLCVDGSPEDREGTGAALGDGSFFMYSVAACGTLPCPPYVNGKAVTCAVCSK